MEPKRDLKLFKALFTTNRLPLRRVKNSPPLQVKRFRVGIPCYLGLNSGPSVLINVSKTRKHFSRNIHGVRIFPRFAVRKKKVSHRGNMSVFVYKMQIMLTQLGREF